MTGCNNGNVADSAAHGIFYSGSLTSNNVSAMNWARTNVIDPTDVNTYDDTLTSITDVYVVNGSYNGVCGGAWWPNYDAYGNSIIGLSECTTLSGSRCEAWTVRINKPFTDQSSLGQDIRQALASHELGHTIGLAHRSSGTTTMRNNIYPPNSRYFDTHDANHINGFY